MAKIHIFDNDLGKETYCFETQCPLPIKVLFVKDRITKQKYLMERTEDEDPFTGHHFLHPCNYNQYDNVEVKIEE